MARPSLRNERRKELMPIVASAFAELGYRRTTTAELASRCGVQENILYRLWQDKKDMFIASIDYIYDSLSDAWKKHVEPKKGKDGVITLLDHEAKHYGEAGMYRIIFAGLSELDDKDIRDALSHMYRRFHKLIQQLIIEHRNKKVIGADAVLSAWAIIGLGTVANIGKELELISDKKLEKLISDVGRYLLDGNK